MKVYTSFDKIEYKENTILTVGTFDGVHKGHQMIINRLLQDADENGLRSVLVTIDPHPRIVLGKMDDNSKFLLTSMSERIELFERFGVDTLFIIPFTYEFSQLHPREFIRDYLVGKIGLKKMLIGHDHMFGKNREGNFELLTDLSKEFNFSIEKVNAFQYGELNISSTKIRDAINSHNIGLANEMLGYKYFVKGVVVEGDRRGRTLGFPTANIVSLDANKILPANGVYFVTFRMGKETYYGMANIGTRPTFTGNTDILLEVNIFDFDKDIYGASVSVEFNEFIRYEQKFSSVGELMEQIKLDKNKCLELKNIAKW
jgi:riboflavin kinase/FMN adenylyltransferase